MRDSLIVVVASVSVYRVPQKSRREVFAWLLLWRGGPKIVIVDSKPIPI